MSGQAILLIVLLFIALGTFIGLLVGLADGVLPFIALVMSSAKGGGPHVSANCSLGIVDDMGIGPAEYLEIYGGIGISLAFASGVVTCLCISTVLVPFAICLTWPTLLLLQLLQLIYSIIMIIIGGVVLYRSNLECIQQGSTLVICGVVVWCLLIIQLIMQCFCCGGKSMGIKIKDRSPNTFGED